MKSILVPVDFSNVSENAAHYAAGLAECIDARLILYHVYSLPLPMIDTPTVFVDTLEMEKRNMKLLEALDKKLKSKYASLETELKNEAGFIIDAITHFTKEHKIDVVVMGVSGSGKSPGALGSNTTSVMHRVKSPVIVTPQGCQFKKPATIGLACDYKSILPDESVDKFKFFAHVFDSKVLVFNIIKNDELATYQQAATEVNMENMLKDVAHSLYFPSGDNLPQEINRFIDKHQVDMLVMFPHHYNLIEGLFHHSATKEMAFISHVPLLSIYE